VSSSLGENVPLPAALAASKASFGVVNGVMLLVSAAVFYGIICRLRRNRMRK